MIQLLCTFVQDGQRRQSIVTLRSTRELLALREVCAELLGVDPQGVISINFIGERYCC